MIQLLLGWEDRSMAHLRKKTPLDDGTNLVSLMHEHRRFDVIVHPNGGIDQVIPWPVFMRALSYVPDVPKNSTSRNVEPGQRHSYDSHPAVEHIVGDHYQVRYRCVLYVVTVRTLGQGTRKYELDEIGRRYLPGVVIAAVTEEHELQVQENDRRKSNPRPQIIYKAPPRRRRAKPVVQAAALSPPAAPMIPPLRDDEIAPWVEEVRPPLGAVPPTPRAPLAASPANLMRFLGLRPKARDDA